jgi:hypothetical protein
LPSAPCDTAGDIGAAGRAFLTEDDFDVVKLRRRAGVEVGARDRDIVAGVGVEAEIDRAVLRVAFVERDVEQAGLAAGIGLRHAAERR